MSAAAAPLARVPVSTLAAYGLFGMPLAMAALPLYVHLPKFYGDHLGVDLAVLGSVLLILRLADGVVDPLLGVLSDRGGARKRWLAAFDANVDKVRAQGFDHRFIRCWRFYLAYCAAGFASETTDVAQYTLVAP